LPKRKINIGRGKRATKKKGKCRYSEGLGKPSELETLDRMDWKKREKSLSILSETKKNSLFNSEGQIERKESLSRVCTTRAFLR